MLLNFYTGKWQAMEIDTCLQFVLARRKLDTQQIAKPANTPSVQSNHTA